MFCLRMCNGHKMLAEVYNNSEIENTRRIATFLSTPVAMHELKVAQSQQRQEFFQRYCQVGPSLELKVLNVLLDKLYQ
jgi:hypothetical protein